MAEKLDLLIKECGDYFDAELVKLEVKYKKFTEDYNKAITNTQEFEIYKANGDDTKIWPKDVFPDKPEIKTYGDLYKWLFNTEYGSVYYNEKEVSKNYRETSDLGDPVSGSPYKTRKVNPISGGGELYHLPTKLYEKLNKLLLIKDGDTQLQGFDPIQSDIYRPLKNNEDDIKRYKMFVYGKNTITPAVFSKKIVEKILSLVKSEYISAKWDKKTANDHWYEGFRQSLRCK